MIIKRILSILFVFLFTATSTVPVRMPANVAFEGCAETASVFIAHLASKNEIPKLKSRLKFVNSVDDFYMHMFNHVQNVGKIADEIFFEIQKNPDQWKSVFHIPRDAPIDDELKSLLKNFIQSHDASKINTDPDFLSKINRKKLIIYELYTVYGKNFKDLSQDEQKIIQALNSIDKEVHDEFILKNHLSNWKVKFFDEIEKLADGIERGSNPVTAEEMAKKPWMESEAVRKKLNLETNPEHTTDEITRLRKKLDFTLILEERYADIALPYTVYKEHIYFLEKILQEANIQPENLRPFSLNHLLNELEREEGQIKNIDDSKLIVKINNFFFASERGQLVLKKNQLQNHHYR